MLRKFAVGAVFAASLLAMPATASAESQTFTDETRTAGPMDIHRVRVTNETRLKIHIKVDDLQRRVGRSAAVWIDTNRDRAGAEYFVGSGLWDSDWQIGRARGWRVVGDGPLACPIDQRLSFDRNVITWTIGRGCLARYSAVRVSVETQMANATDYSPRRHRFHAWVKRHEDVPGTWVALRTLAARYLSVSPAKKRGHHAPRPRWALKLSRVPQGRAAPGQRMNVHSVPRRRLTAAQGRLTAAEILGRRSVPQGRRWAEP